MLDLPLEALGALSAYVAVTVIAPDTLIRPALITRFPRLTLGLWLGALSLSIALLWLGTGLIIAEAVQRVENGVEPEGWLTSVVGSILTWLSFAFLGIIAFRLVVAVQTVAEDRRSQIEQLAPLLNAAMVDGHDGERLYVVDEPDLVLAAVPFAGAVVTTTGTRSRLSPEQFDAALAHERTHLRHRHSLLVSIGQLAIITAGGLAASRRFTQAIRIAIELIADDSAAARHGAANVADALEALYPTKPEIVERTQRLRDLRTAQ